MSTISPELERIMRDVGAPDSEPYKNLRSVVESSPVLVAQMNEAAAQGHLKHFALLASGTHAGASYSPTTQTINLKASDLSSKVEEERNILTFRLGHEVQHGFNRSQTQKSLSQFEREVQQVYNRDAGGVHNYTASMQAMLSVNRNDEASAHIAGWNAVVSSIRQKEPDATLKTIYDRMGGYRDEFIARGRDPGQPSHAMQPGIRLNADLTIAADAANVESVARNYFDQKPEKATLGPHGNSDYPNLYATNLIGAICQREMSNPAQTGQLMLDMKALKLDETLLEQNGISLGDPPKPGARCPYRDTAAPSVERYFDHTANTLQHVPVNNISAGGVSQDGPAQAAPGKEEAATAVKLPQLRDDPMFAQAQALMRELDERYGRTSDARTDNAAASLTVAAKRAGWHAINDLEPSTDGGKTLFIVQGKAGHVFSKVEGVPTTQALDTPVAQSEQAYAQVAAQQQAEQQAEQQQRQQQKEQSPPQEEQSPVLKR